MTLKPQWEKDLDSDFLWNINDMLLMLDATLFIGIITLLQIS